LLMLLGNSKQYQTSKSPKLSTKAILIIEYHRVTSLSNILRDIECVLSQLVLTDWQKKALISLLEECRSVLITLGKVVDENYYLNPSDSHGLRNKSRRMWKILKWEPDNIQELRLRVALNVCLLNAFNGSLMRCLSEIPVYILQVE
jgi:hypothetical protein